MPEDIYLSIVIPTYNERENIGSTLSDISEYLKDKDLRPEVIVIDDGSADDTVSKASPFKEKLDNFRLIESTPNRGKGYVIKKAVLEAKGQYVLFMDADSSVLIKELDKFLPELGDASDIYIASRRIPGADVTMPALRDVLGRIYVILANMVLATRVKDINCGFKIFKRVAAREIFVKKVMDDWSFDAEVLFLARKFGYTVKEVPVKWVYKDTSKVRPMQDGISSFRSLLKIRGNDIRGIYTQ